MRLLSSNIKPYIPSAFDEKINREKNFKKMPELMQLYEQVKKEGYDEGFKQGFEKGHEEGLKKSHEEIKKQENRIKDKIYNLDKIVKELSDFKQEQIKNFLPEILALSIKIAKKIVSAEISINEKIILNIIKEALKEITLSEQIIIKINPLDFKNLSEELNQLISDNPSIKIITSPDVNQGGCYIESQEQIIDATIEEKFKEIENVLNSVIYSKD